MKTETKESKTAEETIESLYGIKQGAADLTPMDYGECKKCMQAYADQQVQAERNKAIQECIEVLINDNDIHFNGSDCLDKLESLKLK